MNKNSYKSEVGSMRGVRYNLRHREVPNSEAEGICRSKHVKNIGKPNQSKKRKRNESTAQKSTIITRSLLKKNMENNIENHNGRNEDDNKLTPRPGQLRSARVNIKRKCTPKDYTTVEINDNLSPLTTDKFENSTLRDCFSEKSLRSKNEGRKKLTRTTVDKNCHDSAKPAVRSCNSKARSQPKVAVSERERKASRSSTQIIGSPKGEIKSSASQGSVLRTSRSGRLLLPTMEFWRNQIPVYDADRGISAIRDGSTILKVKARKGTKSCTKERRLLSWS